MNNYILSEEARSKVLTICKEIAASKDIIACSFYGPYVCGYADEGSNIDVLLITGSPKSELVVHHKPIYGLKTSILAVDQKTFEKDVEGEWLGGLLVENILAPYEPLVNSCYLQDQEVKAKKRIVIEILGNLVSEFPEMSYEILIKPEYFMFESMTRKASLFPPIAYFFLNLLRSDLKEKNLELIMRGFRRALEAVANEGYITFFDENVKISVDIINALQRRHRIMNIFKPVRSGIFRYTHEFFPHVMRSFLKDYQLYLKHFGGKKIVSVPLFDLEETDKYIFIPTPLGLVSLSDKVTIEDFIIRNVPNSNTSKMELKKLGGILNTVYILNFKKKTEEQKIVVKVFKDWHGWKWFPLALWAIGTRGFAVLGKSRLQKEYAINKYLSSQGFHVPKIVYVSPKERLIFQEFINGSNLAEIIKETGSSKKSSSDLAKVIEPVGREIAKVHSQDVALGDCKPENIIITPNGRIYFIDLEQAERGGDQAWDIAELLYYSGHSVPLSSTKTAYALTKGFIKGYLEAGGKTENIKKVRSPRYMKVFSFFTPPHLILSISRACKETEKTEKRKVEI